MLFKLVNIDTDSRLVNFIFRNNDEELVVKTRNGDMFVPNVTYDIHIMRKLEIVLNQTYSLGVVTRKTRKSVRIQSGTTLWIVPHHMCQFNPGMDVWIYVSQIVEKN